MSKPTHFMRETTQTMTLLQWTIKRGFGAVHRAATDTGRLAIALDLDKF